MLCARHEIKGSVRSGKFNQSRDSSAFQMQSPLLPYNLNPFMISLQRLGSDAIPPTSFTNPGTGNRSLYTLPAGLLCQLNRRKRPIGLRSQWAPDVRWGHCDIQGKLSAVALHRTAEISKQLPRVTAHPRASVSDGRLDDVSGEGRKRKTRPSRKNEKRGPPYHPQ